MIAAATTQPLLPWTKEQIAEVTNMVRSGMTDKEIAEKTGRTRVAIKSLRQRQRREAKSAAAALASRPGYETRDIEADEAWKHVTSLNAEMRIRSERGPRAAHAIRTLDADLQVLRLLTHSERIGFLQAAADWIDLLGGQEGGASE